MFEDLPVKQAVMAELGRYFAPDCILATNTSSLDVDAIAEGSGRPERHDRATFFQPGQRHAASRGRPGDWTRPEVTAACMSLGKRSARLRFLPETGPDSSETGVSSYLGKRDSWLRRALPCEEVNEALVQFGMGMGPLAVDDLIGIDVSRHIEEEFGRAGEPRGKDDRVLLEALYRKGTFGQKNGKGWSEYGSDRKPRPNPEIEAISGASGSKSRYFTTTKSAGKRS